MQHDLPDDQTAAQHQPPDDPTVDKKDDALRAQRFRMLEEIAQELSSGDLTFPTSFDTAMKLRDALRDPDVSRQRVAGLVGLEPLIVAKILRLANSAAVNLSGRAIKDIDTAISRIGLESTRTIAIATAMEQLLRAKSLACFGTMADALWMHTLRTAATARVIATRMTRISGDEALMAGLVHDLGAFYILYRSSRYEELRIRPDSVRHLILQWHESIGESLMHVLGLPERVIDATREHEQARSLERNITRLEDVIYVANVRSGGTAGALFGDDAPAPEPLPLHEEQLAALAEDIESEYQSLVSGLS